MLTLGLPSKGRLQADSISVFAEAGLAVERAAEGREYAGRVTGIEGVRLALLSAGEIPRALAEGEIHLGVTGEDLIRERLAGDGRVRLAKRLGFGRADLVVAVPAVWADVETMHDLDEAAAAFRARRRRPLRVATKYHALTRAFFAKRGVADYRLVDSQGATEATPRNGVAEAIVDITSSGETLRANHLRALGDGLILASEACLWVSAAARWSAGERQALAALAGRMGFAGDAP